MQDTITVKPQANHGHYIALFAIVAGMCLLSSLIGSCITVG